MICGSSSYTRAKQAVVEFTGKGYPNWTHVGDKKVHMKFEPKD
jgi:hypothetical protein